MCILNSICKGHNTPATIKGVLRILARFVAYICNVTQRDTNRIATTVRSVLWYQLSRNGTVSGHKVTPSLFIEYMNMLVHNVGNSLWHNTNQTAYSVL